jgi:ADP-heptose:LPS heptosyltransferase
MIDDNLIYFSDCAHFLGYIPCKPHKLHGVHCKSCHFYSPKKDKVLIIKLGAIGDVIRTTPLLHRLFHEYPASEIWWLTYTPDIVPSSVHKVMKFTQESVLHLEETDFDTVINLDKDYQACALAKRIKSKNIYGFTLVNGKPAPANDLALDKFLTGLFDDVNKANNKSYLDEIFEICGLKFKGEEYILEFDNSIKWELDTGGKKVIGLNTGCGDRWISRLWPDRYWIELINQIKDAGFYPLLLGGSQEHEKNSLFANETGAYYPGHFPLQKFISLVNQCDLVVSAVTMGLHIAVGLKKKIVLINNIFNPKEFELYGRGEIISPDKECKCYFNARCSNDNYFCLDTLSPTKIFESIKRQLA